PGTLVEGPRRLAVPCRRRLLREVALLGLADLLLGGRVLDRRVLDGLGAGFSVVAHVAAVPRSHRSPTAPTPRGGPAICQEPIVAKYSDPAEGAAGPAPVPSGPPAEQGCGLDAEAELLVGVVPGLVDLDAEGVDVEHLAGGLHPADDGVAPALLEDRLTDRGRGLVVLGDPLTDPAERD